MSLIKEVKEIKELMKTLVLSLTSDELTTLEKEYKEYRTFADARGMKMLSEAGLVDEYNEYMTACETVLFGGAVGYSAIELPKPSDKLEAFKNKFNKFFK